MFKYLRRIREHIHNTAYEYNIDDIDIKMLKLIKFILREHDSILDYKPIEFKGGKWQELIQAIEPMETPLYSAIAKTECKQKVHVWGE